MQLRLTDYGRTVELTPPLEESMISRFNPSILYHDGKFVITVRESTYTLFNNSFDSLVTLWKGNKVYHSVTYITECTNPFDKELKWKKLSTKVRKNNKLDKYRGAEDIRLINWNNELYYSAARKDWEDVDTIRIEEGIIMNNSTFNEKQLPSIDNDAKNYIPFEGIPNTYIYQLYPYIVLKDGTFINKGNNKLFNHRGSTQAIKYKDGYITITHSVEKTPKGKRYSHYFVIFDKDLNPVSVSQPFSFDRQMIEFACGLCIVGNDMYITYGLMDSRAFVLKLDVSILDELTYKSTEVKAPNFNSNKHLVIMQYKYNEQSNEILYALDTFRKHAKFDYDICIVGDDNPLIDIPVIDGDHTNYEKTTPCRGQHIRVAHDLQKVCNIFKEQYDEFCLMSDDFFCLNDFTWEDLSIPKYNNKFIKHIHSYDMRSWIRAKWKTAQLLIKETGEAGIDFTTHTFAVYNIENLLSIINEYKLLETSHDYTIEDLYGNRYCRNAVDVTPYRIRVINTTKPEELITAKRNGVKFANFCDNIDVNLMLKTLDTL